MRDYTVHDRKTADTRKARMQAHRGKIAWYQEPVMARELSAYGRRYLYRWLIVGILMELAVYLWTRYLGVANFFSSIGLSIVFLVEMCAFIITLVMLYKKITFSATLPIFLKSCASVLFLLFSFSAATVTDQSKFILQAYLRTFAFISFYGLTAVSLLLALWFWFMLADKSSKKVKI